MDLEERVAELEHRLAALERAARHGERPAPGAESALWALEGLRARLAELGADGGGVLFAGTVRLPGGGQFEWQEGLTTDDLLDADWSEAAASFAALGHPVRMRLLREIAGGRRTAAALAGLEDLGTTGQIYHHLRQLTAEGWLHAAARGRYEIPAARVVPLLIVLAASRS
ncbi:helix-turn-helix transcriptional regulator [Streptomyces sp. YIM 98790]|uniref:ArsR/SmtB family transcription factor n=1 Tax=Streptomyces sp. YIM 98790 TaxID=2689077 RepID=UPI0014074C4A|nr:winged helix-turn-helix domain-containing protein [Streptomyces sp. YIM 98790]